jgi:ribose transport system permease protein
MNTSTQNHRTNPVIGAVKGLLTKNSAIPLLICVIMVVTMSFTSKVFWSPDNMDSLQTSIAPIAIVSLGMVLLLICGVFDLSVGAIMVLSGIVCAKLFEFKFQTPVVIAMGLLVGLAVGLLNGTLVGILKINPLIATIGTMNMAQGIAMIVFAGSHKGQAEYQIAISLPQDFIRVGTGRFLGLYYMFWVMLILLVLVFFLLRHSPTGRKMFLTGDNPEAARMMGFNTPRITLLTYGFVGLLCAVAGILSVARFEQANRYLGEGVNITAIISCILGGASFAGGRGSAVGTVVGVLLMTLITNLFNLLEIPSSWQNVVVGAILIAVISIDGYLILKKQRELGKI